MAAHPLPRLTPEDYLRIERESPIKHEYYDGTIYAMPGVSFGHWLIANNLVWKLGTALESVCRLESVGAAIPLAQIYSKVEFPAEGTHRTA